MSLISVSGLTFGYEGSGDNIFENVSFQIDTNWRLGFIGRNGRGKTTFLKLLLGEYSYSGSISSSEGFDYFPFKVKDKTRMTYEIAEEICFDRQHWEILKELSLLKVPEDALYRPFNTLSNGEQTKVLLAAMFLKSNSFFLIDEPTNHLDLEARDAVAKYLKSKKGFILVSHDRKLLDEVADHILSINKTNIEVQKGNFSTWQVGKQRQDDYEAGENEKLKKEIVKMKAAAARTADWSNKTEATKYGGDVSDRGYAGHMAAKMMKRSKTLESRQSKAIEEKSKLLKNTEESESLKIHPLEYHSKVLAEAKNLSVFYNDNIVFEGVDFTVESGQRVAIRGKNGSGKSSILKLMAGEEIPHSGRFKMPKGVVISYLPQDTSFLKGSLEDFISENNLDQTLFKAILRKLDFDRAQFGKTMEAFSEGQKKKALIAKSLCQRAHLYIWDEPLNFIDVISRIQIEEMLLKFKPTMVFVEHDTAFNENIATKTIDLL